MANNVQVRGIQVLRTQNGIDPQLGTEVFSYTASRTGGAMVGGEYGRWVVDTGVLDAAGRRIVETANATDTTAGGTRKVVGVTAILFDTLGNENPIQYASATTAGLCQCYTDINLVWTTMMSGVPTAYGGSFCLTVGAVTNFLTTYEPYPTPVSTDLLDSTSYSATVTTNAFRCIGIYPCAQNQDTASPFPANYMLNSGFHS